MTALELELVRRAIAESKEEAEEEAQPWLLPVQHFSPSALGMLLRCPEQYRQRYVLGRKERPTSNLTLGTAIHSAIIDHNLGQKIESHEDVPLKQLLEYYNDEGWPKAIERDGGAEEIVWRAPQDDTRLTGAQMVALYHGSVAPRVQPTEIEKEVTLEVGLPVPIHGRIDVVTAPAVIDVKSSARKVSTIKPAWRLQGGIYMLFENRHVDWHLVTSTKAPAVVTPLESEAMRQPYTREAVRSTLQMVDRLAWMANAFMGKYGHDHPWPMVGYATDACGWCGFQKYCAAWGNEA